MGVARPHEPVMLIIGAFSRHEPCFDWTRAELESRWGPVLLQSEEMPFEHTFYYAEDMGTDLRYRLYAFSQLIDPGKLAEIKLETNKLEHKLIMKAVFPESRPLNLDPGYLATSKLVLATTKDATQRVYLAEGVYAETTLERDSGKWVEMDWTYPHYREKQFQEFLNTCRPHYLKLRRNKFSDELRAA